MALVLAITGFLFLYETRSMDSTGLQALMGDVRPDAGSRLPFNATAYCKGQTTASGVNVRTGIAAADAGLLPVGSVLNVGTGDPHSDHFRRAVAVAERYDHVFASVGVHPHDAKLYDDAAEQHLLELV